MILFSIICKKNHTRERGKKLMIEIKCESNYEMLVKESVALNKEL